MAETKTEEKVETPVVPKAEIKTETKTDTAPKETAKAIPEKTAPVETKTEPAKDAKTETKAETPAEELKTLLDEAGEEKTEVKEGEAKAVPEKYEFKLPEGMMLDEASMAIASPIFKELGLDNASAQKLVDLQAQLNKASEDAHATAFGQYVEGLKKESKEFFGPKLPEVMKNVARARDQFIHKELQDKLNVSGLANDKDVLVMLDKLGRTVGEGKFIEGKRSAPAKGDGSVDVTGPSLKDVYPSMATK